MTALLIKKLLFFSVHVQKSWFIEWMIGLKWIFSGVFHGIERYKDCLESQATKAGQPGKLIRKGFTAEQGEL